jgi:hypothetical protein
MVSRGCSVRPARRAGQRIGFGRRNVTVRDEQRQDFLEAQRASGDFS